MEEEGLARGEQCAAAIFSAAMTRRLGFDFFRARDVVVGFQVVIVKQFFAGPNGSQSVDEDAAAPFADFAIRIARMIDPARFVSTD